MLIEFDPLMIDSTLSIPICTIVNCMIPINQIVKYRSSTAETLYLPSIQHNYGWDYRVSRKIRNFLNGETRGYGTYYGLHNKFSQVVFKLPSLALSSIIRNHYEQGNLNDQPELLINYISKFIFIPTDGEYDLCGIKIHKGRQWLVGQILKYDRNIESEVREARYNQIIGSIDKLKPFLNKTRIDDELRRHLLDTTTIDEMTISEDRFQTSTIELFNGYKAQQLLQNYAQYFN